MQRRLKLLGRQRGIYRVDRTPGQLLGDGLIAAECRGPRRVQQHGTVSRRLDDGILNVTAGGRLIAELG